MSMIKKGGIIALYSIGVLMTLTLLCLFLSRTEYVLNPDSMLPAPLWETATEWLALGALPMSIASLLFDRMIFQQKAEQHKKKYWFIYTPAVICIGFLLFWIGVLAIGFFNTLSHF